MLMILFLSKRIVLLFLFCLHNFEEKKNILFIQQGCFCKLPIILLYAYLVLKKATEHER